jgi:hypothetical protein
MTIGHQVAGIHKKQWRVNDRKLLTEAGRAALDRSGAPNWRRGKPPGRDTVVWSLDYRCGGTASCRPMHLQGRPGYPCAMRVVFSATIAQVAAGTVLVAINQFHHPELPYVPPPISAKQPRTRDERDQIRELSSSGLQPDRVRSHLQWTAQRKQQELAEAAAPDPTAVVAVPRVPSGAVPSKAYISQVRKAARPPLCSDPALSRLPACLPVCY